MALNMFRLVILASCLVVFVFAATFPGPQVVRPASQATINQYARANYPAVTQEWEALPHAGAPSTRIYPVRDFGPGRRPKLVYNCAIVKMLCQNVKNYMQANNMPNPTEMHYDKCERWTRRGASGKSVTTPYRTDARRGQSCPSNWIDQRQGISNKCPQLNPAQEDYLTQRLGLGAWQTPLMNREVKDYIPGGSNPPSQYHDISKNYFGRDTGLFARARDVLTTWEETGIMLTCDEWPAASWLEGGVDTRTARTICAPQNAKCGGGGHVNGGGSEQNWQGLAHKALGTMMNSLSPVGQRGQNNTAWMIYKFNFEWVNDPLSRHAVWVEDGGGTKRSCYGPVRSGC